MAKNKAKRVKADTMKTAGMNIKTRLIVSILPIVAGSLIVLTGVTTIINQSIISSVSDESMVATLGEHTNDIAGDLQEIKSEAETAATFVGSTYGVASVDEYKKSIICCRTKQSYDSWFRPLV